MLAGFFFEVLVSGIEVEDGWAFNGGKLVGMLELAGTTDDAPARVNMYACA